jgi:hypothetical protein
MRDLVSRLREPNVANGHFIALEAADEIERLREELIYAYRCVQYGFEFGNFDFTVLRQKADHLIDGKPLPPHLQ